MEHSRAALGQAIRALREAQTPRLSQEELGRRAGYRTGAGVSVSRIENGVTRPSPRRLAGIASALGVNVGDLESRGGPQPGPPIRTRPDVDVAAGPDGPAASAASGGSDSGGSGGSRPSAESGAQRMRSIQGEFERRQAEAVAAASAFNDAHDRARDEFFLPLVGAARSVAGLPLLMTSGPPSATTPNDTTPSDTTPSDTEARVRRTLAVRGIAAALSTGGAAPYADDDPVRRESAYNDVVATAVLSSGAATDHPRGAAPVEPSATAAARAARALLAGSRPLGGPRLVAGAMITSLVATAASPLLAATALAWIARRSRRQNEQLARELAQAEAHLAATGSGFAAVMDLLRRATETLDYLALHGGHAQRRWAAQLPPTPRQWSDLRPDQQAQLAAFVELAAAQVCVDTIDMTELLAATGAQQDALVHVADEVLSLARADVERLV